MKATVAGLAAASAFILLLWYGGVDWQCRGAENAWYLFLALVIGIWVGSEVNFHTKYPD